MKNKEFSLSSYKILLNKIKKNYQVIDYADIYKKHISKTIVLRHDIDVSLVDALKIAEIEYEVGIKSTYFIWLRSEFYNPLSIEGIKIIKKIVEFGHSIGLHFDPSILKKGCELDELALQEIKILEEIINIKIDAISFHQPPRELISTKNDYISGLPQTYSENIFNKYAYYADSNCKWSKPILNVINGNEEHVQLLVHPEWWVNDDVEYRYRVLNSISRNKMMNEIYHLSLSGLFNEK